MSSNWIDQINAIIKVSQHNLPLVLTLLGSLWGIYFLHLLSGRRLNYLGIYPRHLAGIPGIIFSPFLHLNRQHLFFNSLPLLILMELLLLYGLATFIFVTAAIILLSGTAVWLFGRSAIHIGASSVVMGYFGFLLLQVYLQPSVISVFIVFLCLYFLGGLFASLFPQGPGVSFEGHVFGFAAGVGTAFYLHHLLGT